jgi:predicted DNA-binding transcriptional regulator YafY
MYFPTTRVLTVLELLQSHHRLSGPELAGRLEVDARTVRRYITMLQDLGIPVESGRGRYGYYRLRPGFKLPPMMFTDEEALALTLGLLAARKMGLILSAPAVEGALAKIERVLPVRLQEQVRAVQDALIFDVIPSQNAPRNEIVMTLAAAVRREQQILLHYRAYGDEFTERAIDPYGLVFRSGFWYMAGYCHLRKGLRVFRLDRVVGCEMLETSFDRPRDFDSVVHVLESIQRTPGTWTVDVLLETTLEIARSRVPATLGALKAVEGGVSLHCYTGTLDWMAWQLVSFNVPFIVKSPPELRDALRKLSSKVAEMAER